MRLSTGPSDWVNQRGGSTLCDRDTSSLSKQAQVWCTPCLYMGFRADSVNKWGQAAPALPPLTAAGCSPENTAPSSSTTPDQIHPVIQQFRVKWIFLFIGTKENDSFQIHGLLDSYSEFKAIITVSTSSWYLQPEKQKADTLAPDSWRGPPLSAAPFRAEIWLRVDRRLESPSEEVTTVSIAAWRSGKESEAKNDVMKRSSTLQRYNVHPLYRNIPVQLIPASCTADCSEEWRGRQETGKKWNGGNTSEELNE